MDFLDSNGSVIRKRLKPKNDIFKKERGGSSEFLDLFCTACDSYIGTYQKDGSGNLFRLYVDRLNSPYRELLGPFESVDEMLDLVCKNPDCNNPIAVPMVYSKENRLAYRIINSIRKRKNHSGKYPPEDINLENLFIES